jgi:hypothetical protein
MTTSHRKIYELYLLLFCLFSLPAAVHTETNALAAGAGTEVVFNENGTLKHATLAQDWEIPLN